MTDRILDQPDGKLNDASTRRHCPDSPVRGRALPAPLAAKTPSHRTAAVTCMSNRADGSGVVFELRFPIAS
jgi:hypothetical protein